MYLLFHSPNKIFEKLLLEKHHQCLNFVQICIFPVFCCFQLCLCSNLCMTTSLIRIRIFCPSNVFALIHLLYLIILLGGKKLCTANRILIFVKVKVEIIFRIAASQPILLQSPFNCQLHSLAVGLCDLILL